jgi:hypothetical protein
MSFPPIPKLTNKLNLSNNLGGIDSFNTSHHKNSGKSFKQQSSSLNYPSRKSTAPLTSNTIESEKVLSNTVINNNNDTEHTIQKIAKVEVEQKQEQKIIIDNINPEISQQETLQPHLIKIEEAQLNEFYDTLNAKIQNRIETVIKNLIERNIAILQLEVQQVILREFNALKQEIRSHE